MGKPRKQCVIPPVPRETAVGFDMRAQFARRSSGQLRRMLDLPHRSIRHAIRAQECPASNRQRSNRILKGNHHNCGVSANGKAAARVVGSGFR